MPADGDGPGNVFPPRPEGAPTGSVFFERAVALGQAEREEQIFREIVSGNVPAGVRALHEVTLGAPNGGRSVTVRVTGDYLAVGSDDDFLRVPLSPITAQRVAD